MPPSSVSPAAGPARRRGRRLALSLAAILAGTVAVSAPAAATASTARTAAAPTAPPPVTVLANHTSDREGDLFITPTGDTTSYANGPEIINGQGQVVWFHAVPQGLTAGDFRTQRYDGQPVLTWWQGTGFGGLASGTDYIYNDHYQQIGTVQAGNGYTADGHEFLLTPWNTALITVYATATANLTSIGGPANQTVIDGIVQEINIKTGQVLWQWNSADHVPYSASEQPLPSSPSTPWDWFHINAVHLDQDQRGTLLIDARDTWSTYDVSQRTGHVNWILGGKDSSFTLRAAPGQTLDNAGKIFAWQHDPESLGHGLYTFFDNESAGTPELSNSRAEYVQLDPRTRTATLIQSDNQPEGLVASSQGDAQTLADRNLVVGWGILPYVSEFSPRGQLLFNAEFPAGVNTYRAYRQQWPPAPPRHHR